MPVVTVQVTDEYYISEVSLRGESLIPTESLTQRQTLVYDLLEMLPEIVASTLDSLGIGGIDPGKVMVVFKKFHLLDKNTPNIWVNLATSVRGEADRQPIRIVLGNSIRGWILRNYPMGVYPAVDVECEFRLWSGVSFDGGMHVLGEW
jgi:hypothetical protein